MAFGFQSIGGGICGFALLATSMACGTPRSTQTPEGRTIVADESVDKANAQGIFVGVSVFYNRGEAREEFALIPFAVDDAVDLAYYFSVQSGLLDPQNILLLVEGRPKKLGSQRRLAQLVEVYGVKVMDATKESIESAFSGTGSLDLLVSSFATHGFIEDDRQFLLSSDSRKSDIRGTAVALNMLTGQVQARQAVLLFDSCRSVLSASAPRGPGQDPKSVVGMDFKNLIERSEGKAILIAAKFGAYAYDDPVRRNGVFTRAFLDLLAEKPGVLQSFVRLRELSSALDGEVCERTTELQGPQQRCGITVNSEELEHGSMGGFPLPRVHFDQPVPILLRLPSRLEFEFAQIPAGEFLMGEPGKSSVTGPVRRVWITRPFQLSKFEVTQDVWQEVMGSNPSRFKNDRRPVESVTEDQVREFLRRLDHLDPGFSHTLPTEAEWEYAAKTGILPETRLSDSAWYQDNSTNETHVVNLKTANSWGLSDMAGNVWEMVADCYSTSFYRTRPRIDKDPVNTSCPDDLRVLKGGSYHVPESFCEPSFRWPLTDGYPPSYSVGFRVLRRPLG